MSLCKASDGAWHCLLFTWGAPSNNNNNTTTHEPRDALRKHTMASWSDTGESTISSLSTSTFWPHMLRPRQSVHLDKQRLRQSKQNFLRQTETWLQVSSQNC